MAEMKLFVRRYSPAGSVSTELPGAAAVGIITDKGTIELTRGSGLYTPDGVLLLSPDASNSVRVRIDDGGVPWNGIRIMPACPTDSAIAKVAKALDDLREITRSIRRSEDTKTKADRMNLVGKILAQVDGIQEALTTCAKG